MRKTRAIQQGIFDRRPSRSESEDCLYLDVTAPVGASAAPVMVWFHPGAFVGRAGSERAFDGRMLARLGQVVVVTFNYRLGALGWLYLRHRDPDLPANPGLLDQVAALGWVQENITAFGGDPGRVLAFGESAGAMSIAALLARPDHPRLLRAAALQSGAGHFALSTERAADVADRVMAEVGARDVAGLRQVDPFRLVAAQAGAGMAHQLSSRPTLDRFLSWGPVVDGDVLPQQPIDAIRRGVAASTPVIVGSNLEEWNILDLEPPPTSRDELRAWLLPLLGDKTDEMIETYEDLGFRDPRELRRAFQTDRFFTIPALRLASAQSHHQPRTFAYLFAWSRPKRDHGPTHGIEQPFVFGHRWPWNLGQSITLTGPLPPGRLVDGVARSWTSFAHDLRPAAPTMPEWRPWSAGEQRMVFDRTARLAGIAGDPRLEAWGGLL